MTKAKMVKKKSKYNIIDSLVPLLVDIQSIKPDPRNARSHNQRNINAITRSLETYGQRKPIVVRRDTMTVEAGNGMLEAAKSLEWDKIAAVLIDDDEDTAKAYGIMDNQSALLAEWDLPNLKDLLQELDTGAFDMDLTGFSADEIEDMMTAFAPDLDNGDLEEKGLKDIEYQVIVGCKDEDEQIKLINKLEKQGYICKPLIL